MIKLKNISIAYKLGISIAIIILISISLIGTFSYYNSKNAIINRTFDQLKSIQEEKTERIISFFSTKTHELSFLLKSHYINDELLESNFDDDHIKVISTNFHNSIGQFIAIKGDVQNFIYFISEDKTYSINILDTVNNFKRINLPNNIISKLKNDKDIIISDYQKSKTLYIFARVPFTNTNRYLGYEIPEAAINNIMLKNNFQNGLGKSGEIYLVGNDFLLRSESRFIPNSVLKQEARTEAVELALSGHSGRKILRDYRDITVLSSYGFINIQDYKWAILSEIDIEEAFVPIESFKLSIVFLSILASILIISFIVLLIHSITQPIYNLKKAANQIAQGDYNINLPKKNNDELGKLSESFVFMASKIKEQNNRIEQERKNRLIEMIDWQEQEKQRFSRELHDGLGQFLLSIKLRLGRAKGVSNHDQSLIDDSGKLLSEAVQDVRNISHDLMPKELTELSLKDAIANTCEKSSELAGVKIVYVCKNICSFNEKTTVYLYRIVQEAINNIIKHSKAKNAQIEISRNNNNLKLSIIDDGVGFNKEKINKGRGLINIAERVFLLDGTIKINTKENEGLNIIINIPLNKSTD